MTDSVKYNEADFDYFASLIGCAKIKNPRETAHKLLTKYLTIENVLTADIRDLRAMVGESAAVFLKLAAGVTSRRATDAFSFGERHTETEIVNYFKALFIGLSVETVYLMGFDKSGAVIGCERICEGTVNATDILPRRLIETAVDMKAASVVLAHNHPFGTATPSEEDRALTLDLYEIFAASGMKFDFHCVVSGQLCTVVRSKIFNGIRQSVLEIV